METFQHTIGFVGAVCAGIVFLALFFAAYSRIAKMLRADRLRNVSGFIRDGALVTIHVSSGKPIERVRFIGLGADSAKSGEIPFELSRMLVFERSDGMRVLVRASTVRFIEEVETGA